MRQVLLMAALSRRSRDMSRHRIPSMRICVTISVTLYGLLQEEHGRRGDRSFSATVNRLLSKQLKRDQENEPDTCSIPRDYLSTV